MAIGLLGRKVGMTQIYDPAGQVIPVTVLQVGPCRVLQLRTVERDKYEAVQIGFLDKPRRLASRSERGHVAKLDSKRQKQLAAAGAAALPKADCEPQRHVREFRVPVADYQVGQVLDVSLFEGVRSVDVVGTSKGRGFAGAMKRHNFKGQRATHGVKKVHRRVGSIGMNTFPHRIFKGKRMAGHMGDERVTVRNIRVAGVDKQNNLLLIKGAVPGPRGGLVMIRPTNRLPVPVPPQAKPAVVPGKKK